MIRELEELNNSDMYPFHMPGHKRRMYGSPLEQAYGYDITEIDGFDNLQDAEGIIKELEIRAAVYTGCEEAHILVNGSTAGILSAISAAVPHRGKMLMARNSHQSAFNAVLLGEIDCRFVLPEMIPDYGLCGGISSEDVIRELCDCPDIKAVYLTSPTYEGFISDVAAIADAAHSHGIPVIVDSAHGAHLPVEKKADLVIMSLHKTLPSFTSTALCLTNGNLIDKDRLHEFINIFQTSSPSYLMMAGIEDCFNVIGKEGAARNERLRSNISYIRKAAAEMQNIRLTGPEFEGKYGIFKFDDNKLLITDSSGTINGREIYERLRQKHHLQAEMAEGPICLAMTSMMDTDDGFVRLAAALKETDDYIRSKNSSL